MQKVVSCLCFIIAVVVCTRPLCLIQEQSGANYYATWGQKIYYVEQTSADVTLTSGTFSIRPLHLNTAGNLEPTNIAAFRCHDQFVYAANTQDGSLKRYRLGADGITLSGELQVVWYLDKPDSITIAENIGCITQRTEMRCYRIYAYASRYEWWYDVGYYTYPGQLQGQHPNSALFDATKEFSVLWLDDGRPVDVRTMRYFAFHESELTNPVRDDYRFGYPASTINAQYIVFLRNTTSDNSGVLSVFSPEYQSTREPLVYVFDAVPERNETVHTSGVPTAQWLGNEMYHTVLVWLALDATPSSVQTGTIIYNTQAGASFPPTSPSPAPSLTASRSPAPSTSARNTQSPAPSTSATNTQSPASSTSGTSSATSAPSQSASTNSQSETGTTSLPSSASSSSTIPPTSIPININDSTIVSTSPSQTPRRNVTEPNFSDARDNKKLGLLALASMLFVPCLLLVVCVLVVVFIASVAYNRTLSKRRESLLLPGQTLDSAKLIYGSVTNQTGRSIDVQAWQASPDVYIAQSTDHDPL